ncbi:hypothetical protein [Streptomyces cellulosae]|nr:hypothetical protein [Streptomyces cellulosae]
MSVAVAAGGLAVWLLGWGAAVAAWVAWRGRRGGEAPAGAVDAVA